MIDFSPLLERAPLPLLGGAFIGLAASLLYATTGRVAGVSGITAGLLQRNAGDVAWRVAFVLGLSVAGTVFLGIGFPALDQTAAALAHVTQWWLAIPAGILVGFGARLGGGCTSGHGVCGISRLSRRSIVATVTFIATGAITVFLLRSFGGLS